MFLLERSKHEWEWKEGKNYILYFSPTFFQLYKAWHQHNIYRCVYGNKAWMRFWICLGICFNFSINILSHSEKKKVFSPAAATSLKRNFFYKQEYLVGCSRYIIGLMASDSKHYCSWGRCKKHSIKRGLKLNWIILTL